MENNLAYCKDNILSKIEKNREIEKALALIHVNYRNKKQLALKAGRFSSEILIDKDLMVDLLKRMKEENEKHIDKYLKLSFDCKAYCEEIRRKYSELQ